MDSEAARDALFAYGTLSLPPLLEALTGRWLRSRPASLDDHVCYRVRLEVYPAAIPRIGASLRGGLYEGIRPADWTLLDRFEGPLYRRRPCCARLEGDTTRAAFVYLLATGREGVLSHEPWSPEEFTLQHLQPYLEACRAFRAAQERG